MTLGLSIPGSKRKGSGAQADIRIIPLNSIVFSPYQARKHFDDKELGELAESIREHGVLQPVLVRPFNKGYELVAGERRVRACKAIGLDSVPAIVKELDDRDVALAGLVENLQREDLGPLEEAEGYKRLIDEFGITQEAIAQRIGKSQSSIANKLRLLRLPEDIREAISREIITERHARGLLSLREVAEQKEAFEHIVALGLNVSQADAYIDSLQYRPTNLTQSRQPMSKRLAVVKDLRIFLNTFKQAVQAVRRAGLEASMEEVDEGDRVRITVTVGKARVRNPERK